MRLRYEITLEDLLGFSLNVHQKSPTLRRNRQWATIGLAIMFVAMFFAVSEILRDPVVFWIGLGGAAIILAIYPRIYRGNVKRLASRMYAEGQNKGLIGVHVAELRDNGLFDGTEFLERTVFWKGIERIESTAGRTFVYLSPMSALVISEHSVLEGNYQAFIEELQNRWQHAIHSQRLD